MSSGSASGKSGAEEPKTAEIWQQMASLGTWEMCKKDGNLFQKASGRYMNPFLKVFQKDKNLLKRPKKVCESL